MEAVSTTRSLSALSNNIQSVNMTGMRFCRPPPSISPAITAISVRWEEVADQVKDRAVVWAIDVAKVEQYGVLMDR